VPRPAPVRRLAAAAAAVLVVAAAGATAAGAHGIVVRPGDTLSSVAAANGVATGDLAAANGIADPNLVVAGTVLHLPARPYRVGPGDTLSSIAAAHGVTVGGLVAANGLADPNVLAVGTVLTIPAGGGPTGAPAATAAPGAAVAAPAAAPPTGGGTAYTVVAGDTLSGIAARFGVSVASVTSANGIADAGLIVPGRTLRIPDPPTIAERLAADPARAALGPTFDQWASAYGVPADLLKAMTWLESGWQAGLTSSAGAVGVGQLLPDTVAFLEALLGEDLDPWDPSDNIRMSARYLRWLLDQTGGDVGLALAGYYQGLASVTAGGPSSSTAAYVQIVLDLRSRF
jgi:N-acetylmuramoyl-L-alanine amidase